MQKSGFLTFCFAFWPGAGHMYQGYMKRGISWMGAFILCATLISTFGTVLFSMLALLVWCAAFFDTFHVASRDAAARREAPDDWLWNADVCKNAAVNPNQHRVIGVVCIVLGAWLCLEQLPRILEQFGIECSGLFQMIESYLPPLALAFALIWLGLRFIRGPRPSDAPDAYRPVTPGKTAAAQQEASGHDAEE